MYHSRDAPLLLLFFALFMHTFNCILCCYNTANFPLFGMNKGSSQHKQILFEWVHSYIAITAHNTSICVLQVSVLTWKTSWWDNTSPLRSSSRLWLDSWKTPTPKHPWCCLCRDPLAQGRTLLLRWSPTTFTKREISVSFSTSSRIKLTSHMQVRLRRTR